MPMRIPPAVSTASASGSAASWLVGQAVTANGPTCTRVQSVSARCSAFRILGSIRPQVPGAVSTGTPSRRARRPAPRA